MSRMMKLIAGGVGATLAIGLWVLAYAVIPILGIWSVNVLFGAGIVLTFKTWLAMFVLLAIVSA